MITDNCPMALPAMGASVANGARSSSRFCTSDVASDSEGEEGTSDNHTRSTRRLELATSLAPTQAELAVTWYRGVRVATRPVRRTWHNVSQQGIAAPSPRVPHGTGHVVAAHINLAPLPFGRADATLRCNSFAGAMPWLLSAVR